MKDKRNFCWWKKQASVLEGVEEEVLEFRYCPKCQVERTGYYCFYCGSKLEEQV